MKYDNFYFISNFDLLDKLQLISWIDLGFIWLDLHTIYNGMGIDIGKGLSNIYVYNGMGILDIGKGLSNIYGVDLSTIYVHTIFSIFSVSL